MMGSGLDALLGRLERAGEWDDAWQAALDHYAGAGIDLVAYGYAGIEDPAILTRGVVSTHPAWYKEYYDSVGAARFDPAIRHMTTSLAPTLGGPDFADRDRDGDHLWRHFQLVRSELGLRSGLVIPLRHGSRRGYGGMILGSRESGRSFTRHMKEHGQALHLASLLADATLVEHHRRHEAKAARLTARERECLLWLSKGLRNDRIAERLGLSNATVEMHLANARRKLGAATREQALAKAVMLGLVEP